jgi:putative DNA-invertase from lambdoid prophage Rac
MQVIAAVAEFERDLLIERTQSGISRARAQGKQFGRPLALSRIFDYESKGVGKKQS